MQDQPSETEVIPVTESMLTKESSRRLFLGSLMGIAAAGTAIAAAPATAFGASGRMAYAAASFPKSDAEILNFALTLEHLEATFYGKVASSFSGPHTYLWRVMHEIQADEDAHVAALTATLKKGGYTPVKRLPTYHFGDVFGSRHALLTFAGELESTGVHAYLGQAGNLKTPELLLTAASIVTVEARHTGALHAMRSRPITEGPFDQGYTKEHILQIIKPIVS